jgi:hypothetical protein
VKRPIPDAVAVRRREVGVDDLFRYIARDDNVIPKIAADLGCRPERMKRVNIVLRPGSKDQSFGTNGWKAQGTIVLVLYRERSGEGS